MSDYFGSWELYRIDSKEVTEEKDVVKLVIKDDHSFVMNDKNDGYKWTVYEGDTKLQIIDAEGRGYGYFTKDGDTIIHDLAGSLWYYKRSSENNEPDMSAFLGSWISYKLENKGQPSNIPENEAAQIVIAKDKTGRMIFDGSAVDFTWTPAENGKKMTITADGESVDIAIVGGELVLYVSEGKAMYFKHGELPVEFGDPNNDKKVDSKDASFVLMQYAKMSTGGEAALTEAEKAAADVNKDGKVDSKDASVVLAYYAYLSTGGTDKFDVFLNGSDK